MSKNAAIYVRASTEERGDSISPEEQEQLCKSLILKNGDMLVGVYRDVRRYRIGTRLVDPLAHRIDRPGYQEMLDDLRNGVFESIYVWRDDRLYSEIESTIPFIRAVEETGAEVHFVVGSFDLASAYPTNWASGIARKALTQEMHKGYQKKLRDGFAYRIEAKYGYGRKKKSKEVFVVEEEAEWINQIRSWYLEGVPVREISRRLIGEGVPQKRRKEDPDWPLYTIYRILKDPTYSTGIYEVEARGEVIKIKVPKIANHRQFQKILKRVGENKSHPARHVKHDFLLSGLVTSPCGGKWKPHIYTSRRKYTKVDGRVSHYENEVQKYICLKSQYTPHEKAHHPDCPKSKGVAALDAYVWAQVSQRLRDPDRIKSAIQVRRMVLDTQQQKNQSAIKHLEKHLDDLEIEREAYIRQYGRSERGEGQFSEADLDRELDRLEEEKAQAQTEMEALEAAENEPISDFELAASQILERISHIGLDKLDHDLTSEEEKREHLKIKRRAVQAFVSQVYLVRGKDPQITWTVNELNDF
jgi:DNA invertase Pin-like site-specific DNA recombinase